MNLNVSHSAAYCVVFAEEKRVENTGIDKILEHPVTVHPEIIKR